jgi:hypothetical protein
MTFVPLNGYQEYVRLKTLKSTPNAWRKCIYCKRQFNKGDYFIGNSRKYQFICRKCALRVLEEGMRDCEKLKQIFLDVIDDLNLNKEKYDNDEVLNNL